VRSSIRTISTNTEDTIFAYIVREIPSVIRLLTQSPPSLQRATIEKFFIPTASFSHPFCRTWSSTSSRWLIIMIYRFYKILSPRIDVEVKSVGMSTPQNEKFRTDSVSVMVAFDETHLKLYVTVSQLFSIFIIPFYLAPVTLTTVLTLTDDPDKYRGYASSDEFHPASNDHPEAPTRGNGKKYWISSQEDLYQTAEFVKFVLPFGIGSFIVFWWHVLATAGCVVGAVLLWPVTYLEERRISLPLGDEGRNVVDVVEQAIEEIRSGSGDKKGQEQGTKKD
jgi:hypothetical protein